MMNRDYVYTTNATSSWVYNQRDPWGYQPTTTTSDYDGWRTVVNGAPPPSAWVPSSPPPKPPDDEGKELFTDEELSELLGD